MWLSTASRLVRNPTIAFSTSFTSDGIIPFNFPLGEIVDYELILLVREDSQFDDVAGPVERHPPLGVEQAPPLALVLGVELDSVQALGLFFCHESLELKMLLVNILG